MSDQGRDARGRAHGLPNGEVALQLRLPPDQGPPGKLRCTVTGPDGSEWRATRAYLKHGRTPFVSQIVFPRDFDRGTAVEVPEGSYYATWTWRAGGRPRTVGVRFEPPQA